jgi:hypothetical protein
VAALREEDVPALLDEQHSLKDAQASWAGTSGVLSSVSYFVDPAFLALPIAVGAIAITMLKRKQNAVERVLADPPRFDYQRATRARRRRYIPGTLGSSPLAAATDQAAIATLRAAAYLEASVRADERSQGARIDGHIDLVDWHFEEAQGLFEVAQEWSGEMALALDMLAISWAAFAVDSPIVGTPAPEQLVVGDLLTEARDAVGRTGLVTRDLDFSVTQAEAARAFAERRASTIGDIAVRSAESTRALARSADEVSEGRRRMPRRTFELGRSLQQAKGLPRAMTGGDEDADRVERQLLLEAEEGSPDAMFDLGMAAQRRSDHSKAREWLARAAALSVPPATDLYLDEIVGLSEEGRLVVAPERAPELTPAGPLEKAEPERVERYWSALSRNGRSIFGAAARIERQRGSGYTLDDLAENLGLTLDSVRSMHRSTGRTAKAWRRDTGTKEPIRLESEGYGWNPAREGNRTSYRLPPGIADLIHRFAPEGA